MTETIKASMMWQGITFDGETVRWHSMWHSATIPLAQVASVQRNLGSLTVETTGGARYKTSTWGSSKQMRDAIEAAKLASRLLP